MFLRLSLHPSWVLDSSPSFLRLILSAMPLPFGKDLHRCTVQCCLLVGPIPCLHHHFSDQHDFITNRLPTFRPCLSESTKSPISSAWPSSSTYPQPRKWAFRTSINSNGLPSFIVFTSTVILHLHHFYPIVVVDPFHLFATLSPTFPTQDC